MIAVRTIGRADVALLPIVLLATASVAFSACVGGRAADQEFRNFKTVAARAPSQGWTAYWLGRDFTVEATTFTGPSVGDFDSQLTGGGATVTYDALPGETQPGGGTLTLAEYSSSAWAKARVLQGPPAGVPVRDVPVAGAHGQLILLAAGTRPFDEARVYVQLGDTMVMAVASSGGSSTPGGPDINPLVDPDKLLSVLQHLRPYPQ